MLLKVEFLLHQLVAILRRADRVEATKLFGHSVGYVEQELDVGQDLLGEVLSGLYLEAGVLELLEEELGIMFEVFDFEFRFGYRCNQLLNHFLT